MELGGYVQLQVPTKKQDYFTEALGFNCGRNALRYVIRAENIKHLWLPAFICPVVWEAVEKEACQVSFYEIDENFMPILPPPTTEYLLYVNYFGLCNKQVEELEEKYPLLLVDNTQNMFAKQQGLASFNSLRKFFGVPDGSYLFYPSNQYKNYVQLETDVSYDRCDHLLQRVECGAQAGYASVLEHEEKFRSFPVKKISKLSARLLEAGDFELIATQRRDNFTIIQSHLQQSNLLPSFDTCNGVPMVYPFLVEYSGLKEYLIREKIYVPTFWKGQKDTRFGKFLEENLIALPIDQRYGADEMLYMVKKIEEYKIKGQYPFIPDLK